MSGTDSSGTGLSGTGLSGKRPSAPGFSGIGHLDLSVSQVEASAAWYEQVLGLHRLRRVEFPDRTMVVLRHRSGLIVGLNQHAAFPGGRFDERRAGLDHVGFSVEHRAQLDEWQQWLASLGVEHSPVADSAVGSALVFRDPDHIQLEMWWSKPAQDRPPTSASANLASPNLVERSSPAGVEQTVQRLVQVANASGLTVFATVDHSAGARSVGMDMPDTRVVILGNPAAGTPAMLAAPDLALDLPTRVLVRERGDGGPGSVVLFHDPAALKDRYGLSASEAGRLAGIVDIVERAVDVRSDA